jgi:hypothetical protein
MLAAACMLTPSKMNTCTSYQQQAHTAAAIQSHVCVAHANMLQAAQDQQVAVSTDSAHGQRSALMCRCLPHATSSQNGGSSETI